MSHVTQTTSLNYLIYLFKKIKNKIHNYIKTVARALWSVSQELDGGVGWSAGLERIPNIGRRRPISTRRSDWSNTSSFL